MVTKKTRIIFISLKSYDLKTNLSLNKKIIISKKEIRKLERCTLMKSQLPFPFFFYPY